MKRSIENEKAARLAGASWDPDKDAYGWYTELLKDGKRHGYQWVPWLPEAIEAGNVWHQAHREYGKYDGLRWMPWEPEPVTMGIRDPVNNGEVLTENVGEPDVQAVEAADSKDDPFVVSTEVAPDVTVGVLAGSTPEDAESIIGIGIKVDF